MTHIAQDFALTPIGNIRPYENNSRRHGAKQIDKIAVSITEFGFNAPILIDNDGVIVAGHGRYEAALKLGLSTVPTINLGHLTDAKRRAYTIADNRIAEDASWDLSKLAAEVQALQAEEIDFSSMGLNDVDFSRIDFELRRAAAELDAMSRPQQQPSYQPQHPAQPEAGYTQQYSAQAPAPAASAGQHDEFAPPPPQPAQHAQQAPQQPSAPQMVPLNILLEYDQRDLVLRVLNRFKAEHSAPTLGAALHALCATVSGEH